MSKLVFDFELIAIIDQTNFDLWRVWHRRESHLDNISFAQMVTVTAFNHCGDGIEVRNNIGVAVRYIADFL